MVALIRINNRLGAPGGVSPAIDRFLGAMRTGQTGATWRRGRGLIGALLN
jgi:hypothetical protein